MVNKAFKIGSIPAILWGEKSNRLFVAVHGNMSHKADDVIIQLAQEAEAYGYQVLSFDLPVHGDRRNENTPCKVQNCVHDLNAVLRYAQSMSADISLFACSMGAYFSLLAYHDMPLKQALFLSPVVDMERIIHNMMTWFNISEEQLRAEQEMATPIGQTLYWDYYCYVKAHPIHTWKVPTSILYGANDDLCEFDIISDFINRWHCRLQIMERGEHYFHTEEQLRFFNEWLKGELTLIR